MSSGSSEVTNVTRAEVSKPTEGEHASLALEVDSKNIIIEETDIQASGGPPDEAGSGLKRRDINEPTVEATVEKPAAEADGASTEAKAVKLAAEAASLSTEAEDALPAPEAGGASTEVKAVKPAAEASCMPTFISHINATYQ